MKEKKLRQKLTETYGKPPRVIYFNGDMDCIRDYYDYRSARERAFTLDEITWNDLDLDRLFMRINPALSTSGEQYLYYMLRSPATSREEYARRERLIAKMETSPELRLKIQLELHRIGCRRRADLSHAFAPEKRGSSRLWLYISLVSALLLSLAAFPFFPPAIALFLLLIPVNCILRERMLKKTEHDFDTVNYSVSLVSALRRLQKLDDDWLRGELAELDPKLKRLSPVARAGAVSSHTGSDFGDMLMSVPLLDLIFYELNKTRLSGCREELFAVHEALGRLDAAIAVASYRASANSAKSEGSGALFCLPELDFDGGRGLYLEGGIHPDLEEPVPNDLCTEKPIVITGSNASGKSTFLKTVTLCAVMAQSICTVPAKAYRAGVYLIFTSMALADNILEGESYYMAESRSLKRILDAAEGGLPVLCAVDEVLRGTNTVERIAASGEILLAFAERGMMALVATHDAELVEITGSAYTLYHFEGIFSGGDIVFDYKLHAGPALTRNAIKLLSLLGFDRGIVARAETRANKYLATGSWKLPVARQEEQTR